MLHREELIKLSVEKAEQAIKSAKDSICMGNFETAQNRVYYSIFYVVSALAYRNNFATSKHKQLMGWFNKKFIHEEKSFDKKLFDTYKEAFTSRQKSDYEFTFMTNKEDIEKSLEEAIFFVEKVKIFLNK